jgi:hypothetical protein
VCCAASACSVTRFCPASCNMLRGVVPFREGCPGSPFTPDVHRRRRMKRAVAVILVAISLSACASSEPPRPSTLTTPLKGQSAEQHARDTNDCQFVAKQQTGYDPATETAKGAGVGAAIGALGGGRGDRRGHRPRGDGCGDRRGHGRRRRRRSRWRLQVHEVERRVRAGVRDLHVAQGLPGALSFPEGKNLHATPRSACAPALTRRSAC